MHYNFFLILFIVATCPLLFNHVYSSDEIPITPIIPEPEPEPQPIPLPISKPIPDPFPKESDSEKIVRLTKENQDLKNKISNITLEKNQLTLQVTELNKKITDLQKIITEQLKVILDLVEKIKVIFVPHDTQNSV